jgi:threonine dehydratase
MPSPAEPFELVYDVSGEMVDRAQACVSRLLPETRLVPSEPLSELAGRPVWLKCENEQRTGSFKVRGALTRLDRLQGEARRKGVVAASAGNHGLGVAWACRQLGIPGLVVVPEGTPQVKLAGLSLVKLRQHGACYDEAEVHALELAREADATFVSPYDDPWVMAGNGGTVGREILRQLPDVAAVVAPLGGGGLAAGLAVGLGGRPVVGVNSEASPAMARSLADGRVYRTWDAAPTIAEGLEGGVSPGSVALCARLLQGVEVVSEASLRRAVALVARRHGMVIEGSAAPPVAALLERRPLPGGQGPLCLVLTGRNIDQPLLRSILTQTPGGNR